MISMHNPEEKILTPRIRFSGFTDAWEQRRLGDVTEVFDGTHQTPTYTDGGVMFVSVEDIATLRSDKYISRDAFEKDFKVHPEKGDTLMTRIGDIGTANVVNSDDDLAFYVSLALLKPREIDSIYLVYCLSSPFARNELYKRTLHIAFPKKINKNEIEKSLIPYPISNAEQRKIGALFSRLDNLIALHQRKCDGLKTVKKSLLEKMFPREGETTPELRFSGFTDAWEQRRLGDIAEIVGGGTPNTGNPDFWDGEIDWYSPAELGEHVYADGSVRRITEKGYTSCSAKMLPANKTILFTSRAGIGNTAILRRSACTNQGFQSLVVKDGSDVYFLYTMSGKLKRCAEERASGSTFLEVSGKQLATIEVSLPQFPEQQVIGVLFSQLDNLIALHQRKLDLLKNVKKSLLEGMFV